MTLRKVTQEQLLEFRETVEADFPGDAMLQEIHLARLILEEEMRDLTPDERVAYMNQTRARRTRAA